MGFVVIVVNRKVQDGVHLLEMHTVTAYFNRNRRENRIRIDGFSLVDLSLSICRIFFKDYSDLIVFFGLCIVELVDVIVKEGMQNYNFHVIYILVRRVRVIEWILM